MTPTLRHLTFLLGLLVTVAWLACVLPPQPSDDDDNDDDASDDDDDTGDDDTGPADDTIYDVQLGLVAEDTIVDLGNVVVTTPVATSGFWISEPDAPIQPKHSGIYVYVPDPVVAADLDALLGVGTAVDVTWRYSEYYDNSEITVEAAADVQVVGNGNIPPVNVSACDVGTGGPLQESYEGVLVRVTNLLVTDENPDDPNDYGEFEVDGCLRVDDIFYPYEPTQA